MNKFFAILLTALSAVMLISINGCKKSNKADTDYTSDFTIHAEDETFVSAEDDFVSNEVNTLIETEASFGGRADNAICDATVTQSSTATTRSLTITYNGQNCVGNRSRTGVVILTLPKERKWKDAGTQLSLTYHNFKITRLHDNNSIILNGTKTITNVSGGNLALLATLRTITHSITSSALHITFHDGTMRHWQISKRREFSFNNGIVISTTGTHTEGTASNIAEWGTNRVGKTFSTQIAEPIVIRQDCNFRIVRGKIVYANLERPVSITFGLNASGVATTCPGTGRYYYKMEWSGISNVARSVIIPY